MPNFGAFRNLKASFIMQKYGYIGRPLFGRCHTVTSIARCCPTLKTRLYRSISSFGPIALLGLSDNLTVGRPFAETALQTSENASSPPFGTKPRKSFVRLVPQPNDTLTRPANWA